MSERIGIAGGGAIASGLACVAAEHGQVVLWARRPDAATAKVEQLIEKLGGAGAGNVSVSDDLDALRVTLNICSPYCCTQPPITSSTCAGSIPARSITSLKQRPSSSFGCVSL